MLWFNEAIQSFLNTTATFSLRTHLIAQTFLRSFAFTNLGNQGGYFLSPYFKFLIVSPGDTAINKTNVVLTFTELVIHWIKRIFEDVVTGQWIQQGNSGTIKYFVHYKMSICQNFCHALINEGTRNWFKCEYNLQRFILWNEIYFIIRNKNNLHCSEQKSVILLSCMLSCFPHVQLFVTLWTIAWQASLSIDSPERILSRLPLLYLRIFLTQG